MNRVRSTAQGLQLRLCVNRVNLLSNLQHHSWEHLTLLGHRSWATFTWFCPQGACTLGLVNPGCPQGVSSAPCWHQLEAAWGWVRAQGVRDTRGNCSASLSHGQKQRIVQMGRGAGPQLSQEAAQALFSRPFSCFSVSFSPEGKTPNKGCLPTPQTSRKQSLP